MNAEEARQITSKAMPCQKQLDEILKQIKQAAESGVSKIFYYTVIHVDVKKQLRELGYKVEADTDRDGYIAKISWNSEPLDR